MIPSASSGGPHAGKNLNPSANLFVPRRHSLDMDQHLRNAPDRDLAIENNWPSESKCRAARYQQAIGVETISPAEPAVGFKLRVILAG
jgi:hypothetical protein